MLPHTAVATPCASCVCATWQLSGWLKSCKNGLDNGLKSLTCRKSPYPQSIHSYPHHLHHVRGKLCTSRRCVRGAHGTLVLIRGIRWTENKPCLPPCCRQASSGFGVLLAGSNRHRTHIRQKEWPVDEQTWVQNPRSPQPVGVGVITRALAVCRRDAGSPPRGWWYTCVHE